MKQTKILLTAVFYSNVAAVLTLVVLFETGILDSGTLLGDDQLQFVITTTMELMTLCLIPSALYLLKMPRIHKQLVADPEQSLRKWGILRLDMLCLPLILNTLFYYMFGLQVAFGYMALILALCLFMVYPSMNRCIYETTDHDTQ